MLSLSDNPQTEYNSLIVTKSDEWYLTHQTTSQLFKSLEINLPISYIPNKEIIKHFSAIHKKIPYCFGDFLYFPIYNATSHHHWCGYHHCIHKQKVGDSLHLYFDQALEIILPYKYATAISHTEVFDSLLKTNQELKFQFYKNYPITNSSTQEQLSITLFCQFFIPIILDYINKVSPDELDETTIEEVLKHFEVFLDK